MKEPLTDLNIGNRVLGFVSDLKTINLL